MVRTNEQISHLSQTASDARIVFESLLIRSSSLDEHTEDLLSIHEEEIRRLKEERKFKGPLLKSIQKYFDICQDQKELAAAAADQTRLLGRGPRDPGRLLREEKMRKRVTKEKPRVSNILCNVKCYLPNVLAVARTGFVEVDTYLGSRDR